VAEDDTYVNRIERELRALRDVFRRNRPLAIAIAILGVAYGLHLGGLLPTGKSARQEGLATEILNQAREYQRLFGEYQRLTAELAQTRDASSRAQIEELEEQLRLTKTKVEERVEKLVTNPKARDEKLAPPPVLDAWRACVESGGAHETSSCDQILRRSLDLLRTGQAAESTGNRNDALRAYTEAIQAGLAEPELAFAYYRRGSVKGYLGDNISGIDDFSKSIRLNPRLGAAYSLRGYLHGVVGQYDLAERDHLAAINLSKDHEWEEYLPWVLQHYADLFRRRGDFEKALDYCEKALQGREYASVHFRRAWIYLDIGRTTSAKADFEKFEQEMRKQGGSYEVFWPDERGAISRLRELR